LEGGFWSTAALKRVTASQAILETIHVNYCPVLDGHRGFAPITIARTEFTGFSARFCVREGGLCVHVKVSAVRLPSARTTPGLRVPSNHAHKSHGLPPFPPTFNHTTPRSAILNTHLRNKNLNMAGNRNRNAVPTGNAQASGTTARPGTIDVYSVGYDGSKTYIGWVTDKNKLAFFSRLGDRVLNPEKYMRPKKNNNRPAPAKRAVRELLLRPNVDKLAGEIVIKYINDNSVTQPKPFALTPALFGDGEISFEKLLNVHHAMSAFEISAKHSSQIVRNKVFRYIEATNNVMTPNARDFKNCMEIIDFDGGIVSKIMHQTMWRSVNRNIDPETLDEIRQYCFETGKYSAMKRIGEEVVQKKLDTREKNGHKGGKPVEHGW
jgi:hypothetical protein